MSDACAAAVKSSSAHATSMKPTAAAEPTTSTSAGKCIIRNETDSD